MSKQSLFGLKHTFKHHPHVYIRQTQKRPRQSENRGVAAGDDILETEDILVIYGSNKDLQVFLKQKLR